MIKEISILYDNNIFYNDLKTDSSHDLMDLVKVILDRVKLNKSQREHIDSLANPLKS